jgi:hypothetical protein
MMARAMAAHDRKHMDGCLTTAQLAHAAGLKSSSKVVAMLKELEASKYIIEVNIEPRYGCGYTVRAWKLAKWYNEPLPDRFIVIGGVQVNWSTGEVKDA